MGVPRKCVKTWIDRYATEGDRGLQTRSSRPRTSPTRTSHEVEQRVLELRRRERRGQDWIGPELGIPPRPVSRILRRHEVAYLAQCDPITGEVIRASQATSRRYERDKPGELVHKKTRQDPQRWRLARPRPQRRGPRPGQRLRLHPLTGR
jgi:hypothetical protein